MSDPYARETDPAKRHSAALTDGVDRAAANEARRLVDELATLSRSARQRVPEAAAPSAADPRQAAEDRSAGPQIGSQGTDS